MIKQVSNTASTEAIIASKGVTNMTAAAKKTRMNNIDTDAIIAVANHRSDAISFVTNYRVEKDAEVVADWHGIDGNKTVNKYVWNEQIKADLATLIFQIEATEVDMTTASEYREYLSYAEDIARDIRDSGNATGETMRSARELITAINDKLQERREYMSN